jgi:hypothetical protein
MLTELISPQRGVASKQKGVTTFRIRALPAAIAAFLTVVTALMVGAPIAQAQPAPPPPGDVGALPTPIAAPAQLVMHGSPVWTFVLVAALTAIVTVAVTLVAVQRRHRSPRTYRGILFEPDPQSDLIC